MQIELNATSTTTTTKTMMDYTSIDEMNQCSVTAADDDVQLHKRAKNIRLTRLRCRQQQNGSACKTRLVLLLLGLWMNLIAVTNGKWKLKATKRRSFFFSSPFISKRHKFLCILCIHMFDFLLIFFAHVFFFVELKSCNVNNIC